jgi:hypothetical protein
MIEPHASAYASVRHATKLYRVEQNSWNHWSQVPGASDGFRGNRRAIYAFRGGVPFPTHLLEDGSPKISTPYLFIGNGFAVQKKNL